MLYPCDVLVRLNDTLDEITGISLGEAVAKAFAHTLTPDDDM
jgi:hypothetical protein